MSLTAHTPALTPAPWWARPGMHAQAFPAQSGPAHPGPAQLAPAQSFSTQTPPTTLAPSEKGCATAVTGPAIPLDIDLPPRSVTTGAGVSIALIDTGSAHPAVRGEQHACLLHGTAVSSVLHAVAPGAGLRSYLHASTPDKTTGTVSDLIAAMDKAVADGAKIINISMVTCERVPELGEAVTRAHHKGMLIVASVGNRSQCQDTAPPYPATFESVLAVGAITARPSAQPGPHATSGAQAPLGGHASPAPQAGQGSMQTSEQLTGLDAGRSVADYNAPGPWADIYAPGGPVSAVLRQPGGPVTIVGDPHPFQGTSFAAPVVSATAALVWELAPQLSNQQVAHLLTSTATPGGAIPAGTAPAAILDPIAAVDAARHATAPVMSSHSTGRQAASSPTLTVTAQPVADTPADYSVPALLAPLLCAVLIAALVVRAFSAESKPPSGSH